VGRKPIDVSLHVDAQTLIGHTEDGRGVSAETARRLCCDAGIVPVLETSDGKILDVGRKTRTIPAAMRRALVLRDHGCRFPGCTNQHVDGHHLDHWLHGGDTKLSNLLSLCRVHHRYVHELGFTIERTTSDGKEALVFRDPTGGPVPTTECRPARTDHLMRLRQIHAEAGQDLNANTNLRRWDGSVPDYDLAVWALRRADLCSDASATGRCTCAEARV
jgi:hypothetical protein